MSIDEVSQRIVDIAASNDCDAGPEDTLANLIRMHENGEFDGHGIVGMMPRHVFLAMFAYCDIWYSESPDDEFFGTELNIALRAWRERVE